MKQNPETLFCISFVSNLCFSLSKFIPSSKKFQDYDCSNILGKVKWIIFKLAVDLEIFQQIGQRSSLRLVIKGFNGSNILWELEIVWLHT
jgi:hypothetical protein